MDAGLKQRLVGAVVLVALAVIFLPMLLDGSGARERLNEDIAIPEQPEAPESRLATDDAGTQGDAGGEDATATLATDEFGGGDTVTGEGAADAPDAGSAGETDAPSGAEAPETGDTAGGDEAPATDDTAGSGSADAPVADGWVVQVGSFQRETNAMVLRDRLRDDDFDANVEQVATEGGTLWRVLIGPVAGREDGEALEKRIEDHRGADALLMEYSE